MKQVQIKNTNLMVSDICLGSANFGDSFKEEQVFQILDRFYDNGGNFVDTARVYGQWLNKINRHSECIIGKWLKERQLSNKVVVATKGGHYDLNNPSFSRVKKDTISWDLDESRKALGLDTIDFYWLHRDNEEMPIEEIIDIMEELVQSGKIRYYGFSNFSFRRLLQANVYLKEKGIQGFSAVSNEWSLAIRNENCFQNGDKTLEYVGYDEFVWHKKSGIPLIPYTSTGKGFFSKLYQAGNSLGDGGKVYDLSDYMNSRNLMIYNDMLKLHREHSLSFMSMTVAFLLEQDFQVIPICGVSNVQQLQEIMLASDLEIPSEFLNKWKNLPW